MCANGSKLNTTFFFIDNFLWTNFPTVFLLCASGIMVGEEQRRCLHSLVVEITGDNGN